MRVRSARASVVADLLCVDMTCAASTAHAAAHPRGSQNALIHGHYSAEAKAARKKRTEYS